MINPATGLTDAVYAILQAQRDAALLRMDKDGRKRRREDHGRQFAETCEAWERHNPQGGTSAQRR